MTTQAKLDAAMAVAERMVDAKIAEEEKIELPKVPVFMRHEIEAQIAAHRAEALAFVRRLLDAGIDAAEATPDAPAS
jgi:hypothetical protein